MQDTGDRMKENEFLKRRTQNLEQENEKISKLMDQARKDAAKIRNAEFEISSLRKEVELKQQVDGQLAESRAKISALTIEKHTFALDLAKRRAEANAHQELRERYKKLEKKLEQTQIEQGEIGAIRFVRPLDRLTVCLFA